MTRLAIVGLLHEANTFSSELADLAHYRATGWHTGQAMLAHYRTSESVVGGYLQAGAGDSAEIVALPVAYVTPCGPITREAFEVLLDEMTDALAEAGPVDGVLLVLHGAAVAEGHSSADAEIAERMRAVVGPDVPIGSVLDMHANVEQRLVDALDVLLAYQTNPHVDARAVGAECRALLLDIIGNGSRPAIALESLPLVVTIVKQDTSTEPMASLLAFAREVESEPGMIDVSILEGFPYADTPQMGMSVLATHADPATARDAARRVAAVVWQQRRALQGGGLTVEQAVQRIIDHPAGEKPLLVLDVGDNIGGGGPGDSTTLLAEALRRKSSGSGFTVFDPVAVTALADARPGDRVNVTAGGRSQGQDGKPVPLSGVVTGRHQGLYEEPKIAHGGFRFFDGGTMIGIRTDDGIAVVLTSICVQPVSPTQYRVVEIEPADLRAIVGKGVNGPRAGYGEICGEIVQADTPGVTRNSVTEFTYRHRRVPMYPFESDTLYQPS